VGCSSIAAKKSCIALLFSPGLAGTSDEEAGVAVVDDESFEE
jgi:hypothetical protein